MNPDRTTCRICCSNDGLLLDIFGSEAQKVTYFEDIDTCLSLKVGKDDGLPQVICVKCAGKLSECTPYVIKVRLLHSQKKQKSSRFPCDICSHCGENGNYLFQIPPESLSKVKTCFNLQVPDKEQICHRCQFHLETLYELQVKSRDTQQNFLNKKLPWQEVHNQKEETVGSMVKSLSKKFSSKMKKSKFSNRISFKSSVNSIADESCSEVSSTVRDEPLDSSDEDVPLAALKSSSSSASQKEAVTSNVEPPKLKRRSSSENGKHDTDSEMSLKRSKQSAHPKHRLYVENQDTLQKRSPKSSPTKLVVSVKNDALVSEQSSDDGGTLKKKSRKASHGKRSHSGMNDSQDASFSKGADIEFGTSSLNSSFNDDGALKTKSQKTSLGKRTHSGMNNSRASSFSKSADIEHGTSSLDKNSAARLPQNKNAIISVIDVCKWLGVDFFSKGPVSATEFSKLIPSNTSTKRVHWAKDVGDFGTPRRGKRVKHTDDSETDFSRETECGEKTSAPTPKSGSQKNENKSSKLSNIQKKSFKSSEALKKRKSTQEEAEDSTQSDEGTTSTNGHVQLSEDKENEGPPRSKPRRSTSKITSYKSMFDGDDYEEDKQSDESDIELKKKNTLSKDDRMKLVNPPYLRNFDMGDTPKKMYKPFICPMCHAGYISTVKGLLHKLMEHDSRSNFTLQLTRCDSDEAFTLACRQNGREDEAMGVTSPKRLGELPNPGTQEKSSKKRGRQRNTIGDERVNSSEAAIPEKSDADHSLMKTSMEIDASNSCKTSEAENESSKTSHSQENDSQITDSSVTDKSINGEDVPAMLAETHVNDPADTEASVSKESNCTGEAHSTHQVDDSDAVSQTTCEEKRSEIAKKSPEEKSSVKDSNSHSEPALGENTLDTVKPADESTKEAHEKCVTKPCVAADEAIKGSAQEDCREVSDAITPKVSKENDQNSEDDTEDNAKNSGDDTERNVEESSIKATAKDSELNVTIDAQESADEVPEDGENEASVEGADEDSMKDADEDSMKDADGDTVKGADEDSVKSADEDSVKGADDDSVKGADDDPVKGADDNSMKGADDDSMKGTDDDSMKGTDEDSVKGAGEDSVKIKSKVSATVGVEGSEEGTDDDSEEGGGDCLEEDCDGISVYNGTLKESFNESCAGDGKTLEDGANQVVEAAETDTTVEGADEISEDNTDQASKESAKKGSEEIVDEVAEEVPKQVPQKLLREDKEVLNAC